MSEEFDFTTGGQPYYVDQESLFVPAVGRAINNTTLVIPGAVCKKWMETGGKICPFCAFPAFVMPITGGKPFTVADYWEMYEHAFVHATDRLTIFNGGSFFPIEEIPIGFQNRVYENYGASDISLLALETRPEYFTEDVAKNIRSKVGTKDVMIMIGLESLDRRVRNKHLKKAMSLDAFTEALRVAQEYNIRVFVYVMLGAPGLSEDERVADTLSTVRQLAELGVYEMSLSTTFVSPGTPLLQLYEQGEFQPPNLWSVIEVMQTAEREGWPLRFGGFEETPSPVAIARSCDVCTDSLYKVLAKHRATGVLDGLPNCSCKTN